MKYKIINRKKLIITILIDLVGYLFFLPKVIFRKNRGNLDDDNIKEILIIRTAYIGDVIMTLPVCKPLKTKYPDARVTFLTCSKAESALRGNPYIDEILTYDAFWFYPQDRKKSFNEYRTFLKKLRSKRYDMVIEARADMRDIIFIASMSRSRCRISYGVGGGGYLLTDIVPYERLKHKVDYHLDIVKYLGCPVDDLEWDIYLTENEEKEVREALAAKGIDFGKSLVAIHPGGRKELKSWSAEGYADIADRLIEDFDATVVFTGSPDEAFLSKRIQGMMNNKSYMLAGSVSLRGLTSVLRMCDLFICNDTSPLHIASAIGTPTVAVFGPSKSIETGPYGNIHRVVENDYPCRYGCDENTCRHDVYNECMTTITPDKVYSAASEIFNYISGHSRTRRVTL
jgi:lipopolysaccharide heptosyltransferase II